MKISIVIPAYKEKGNLKPLVKRFYKVFKNINYEIIFVLKGSKEESGYNEIKNMSKVNAIYADNIIGYGSALVHGFKNISKKSDYVLTMDADNHSPEEALLLLSTNADIIIGSRGNKRIGSWWKKLLSRTLNNILSLIWKLNIIDITSGYRVYKRKVLNNIFQKPKSTGFEYLPELLIIAKKEGCSIKEVPITFNPRIIGESKMPIFKTMLGYIKLILRYL